MNFQQAVRPRDGRVINAAAHRPDSWVGPIMTVLIVLIIAAVALYLIKTMSQAKTGAQPVVRDPLDLAKERFAKGEISKDEFNDIKKELK